MTSGRAVTASSADARSGSLVMASLVLVAGLAVCVSPYVWSEAWQLTGPSVDFLGFHLAELAPFCLLAALAGLRGGVRPFPAAAVALALSLFTALVQHHAVDAADAERLMIVVSPLLAAGLVLSAWQLDVALRERRPPVLAIAGFLVVTVVAGRAYDLGAVPEATTFVTIFSSIVIEALPFVLLGALASGLIEVFVPDRIFERFSRLPMAVQLPGMAMMGMALPVCECGSVPVARRLILRGIAPSAGIAFMLAAPIMNPVVLFSTAVAYQGNGALEMVLGRALLGLTVAIVAGALIGRLATGKLADRIRGHDHGHHHDHGGRARAVIDHLTADVFFMGKFVVAGGALAATLQTAVPQDVFTGVLTSPFVGALLLMAFAFLLSLCSEADAFVAVSFIQFPPGPQLAFLVFGPILDIKLALIYGGLFGRRFVIGLLIVALPTVLAGSMLFQRFIA